MNGFTRVLVLLQAFFLFYGAAQAQPIASLRSAAETASVSSPTATAIAFFQEVDDLYNVTIVISDSDGGVLRTRIGLRDGQRHTISLAAEDETQQTSIFRVERRGDRLDMSSGPLVHHAALAE